MWIWHPFHQLVWREQTRLCKVELKKKVEKKDKKEKEKKKKKRKTIEFLDKKLNPGTVT